MMRSKVLWACVLLSLAGCQDEMGGRVCSPGRTEACACAEGAIGVQTCNADGSAWEGCRCPEPESEGEGEGVEGEHPAEGGGVEGEGEGPPSLVCEPGRTESCACVGFGVVGAQICNDDGSAWEECRCPALEGEGEGSPPPVCEPGKRVECTCPDAPPGFQECSDDGLRWLSCVCPINHCAACLPLVMNYPGSISDCNAALEVPGLVVDNSGSEERRQQRTAVAYLCDTSNTGEIVEQARSVEGGGEFNLFNRFGIQADASREEQTRQVRIWQTTTCRMDVEELSDEQVRQYLNSLIDNRPALTAWAECVRNIVASFDYWIRVARNERPVGLGLFFEQEPARDGPFSLLIRYCGTGGDAPICSATVITRLDVNGAECEHHGRYEVGQQVRIGEARVACVRSGGSSILATLTVEVEGGLITYSAVSFLPELCPIGGARCVGNVPRWCEEESGHWQTGEPCLGEDGCVAGVCRCEPGTSIECNCDDGRPGERLCVQDNDGNGEHYLPCDCPVDPEVCDGRDNDLDRQIDEDPIGVEADVLNCGACGIRCADQIAHAEAVCEGGRCGYEACDVGFVDLDGNPANGCETECGVVNLLALQNSEHQCEGGVNADGLSIDGDASTAYSADTGVVQPANGGHGVSLQCDYLLSEPRTIHRIAISISAYGRATGRYIRDHNAGFALYYRQSGDPVDEWRVLGVGGANAGCGGGDGDCGVSTGGLRSLEVHLENVVAVRARAYGFGNASGDEGAVQGSADIYEVQTFSNQCD